MAFRRPRVPSVKQKNPERPVESAPVFRIKPRRRARGVFHRSRYSPWCFVFFRTVYRPTGSHPRGAEEGSIQASDATGEVVDALIGCQFEETQQGHDEAVRARIMQVMVGCLEGGAGTWLPDEVVWEVLQTCMANLDQMVRGLVRGQICCRCG